MTLNDIIIRNREDFDSLPYNYKCTFPRVGDINNILYDTKLLSITHIKYDENNKSKNVLYTIEFTTENKEKIIVEKVWGGFIEVYTPEEILLDDDITRIIS